MSLDSARLPIYDVEQDIVAALQTSRRLILQAPTGSGKSTQLPQMLLRHGFLQQGRVVTLQPRRLAARLLALRVAQELGVEVGREVGYQVRFENVTSPATRIKFETEGILLRQMVQDPTLNGIQALVFDEFHERHLYGDITLARALDIQEQFRPDLLLIVMSATLDAGALERYLSPCVVLKSEGRVFPVEVDYLQRRLGANAPPVWDLAAEAFSQHAPDNPGDVLIFMPGGYEIQRTLDAIRRTRAGKGYVLLALHGELPPREQDAAVARYTTPKVVVATNVAETSITIDGVRLVIDSGLARIPRYDANRGINTLLIERISQSSAEQRAGRAGRTAAGRCVRLWSQSEQNERPLRDLPEVKRLDLSEVVLTLKAAGVKDLMRFRWLDPPAESAIRHAEELLVDLGALKGAEEFTEITSLGHRMLSFPVHPRYARMLIAAAEYGCVYEACLVAALTQGRDLLLRNPGPEAIAVREAAFGKKNGTSDFELWMSAWEYAVTQEFQFEALRRAGIHAVTARQVGPLLKQFLRIAGVEEHREPGRASFRDDVRKCILIGFSDRVARRIDDGTLRCELVHGRRGQLAKESVVRSTPHRLFVASEIQEVGGAPGEVNTILSLATAIDADWLFELFPADVATAFRVLLDSSTRRVYAEEQTLFRDLQIRTRRVEPVPEDAAALLLAGEIAAGRLQLSKWDHSVNQWILRLNLLAEWCPDLQLPPIRPEDERHILEQICLGAMSYKEARDREVRSAVHSWLSPAQRELVDKYAPERVKLPNGRTPRVTYESGVPPYISLRIQELYGVNDTPAIAMGRVPLRVHILAPSMRPVQVTQDLQNFWQEHYPRIKSQLQRKYPKHEWR